MITTNRMTQCRMALLDGLMTLLRSQEVSRWRSLKTFRRGILWGRLIAVDVNRLMIMKLFLLFSAVTKKEAADVEYNDALLRIVHDEEPTGVPMGVNIQVSHFNSYIHVLVCHGS